MIMAPSHAMMMIIDDHPSPMMMISMIIMTIMMMTVTESARRPTPSPRPPSPGGCPAVSRLGSRVSRAGPGGQGWAARRRAQQAESTVT